MNEGIEPGTVYDVSYPFCLEDHTFHDEDGAHEGKSWRPGTKWEPVGPEDAEMVADALGVMILTVVSTHKPGRYPERVFYTRRWADPGGKKFGKTKLMITTKGNFRRLTRGYRHEFNILNGAE